MNVIGHGSKSDKILLFENANVIGHLTEIISMLSVSEMLTELTSGNTIRLARM